MRDHSRFWRAEARSGLAGASAAAVLVWAVPAQAEPCPVEITGTPSEQWQRAARELAAFEAGEGDCAKIDIEITETGARLTFTTRDGRRAERALDDPDELLSTVDALRVTGSLRQPPAEPASKPNLRVAAARAPEADTKPVWRPEPASSTADGGVLLGLQAGARGGAGQLISPVLAGSASLALRPWELGVWAALDLQYFDPGDNRAPSSAAVVGVNVGRREPLGNVALLAGGRLMFAALNDESRNDTGERGGAEVRLGAYSGIVMPRGSKTRFRADLGVDIVAAGATTTEGPADDPSAGDAITPWWAMSALVGVEIGGT